MITTVTSVLGIEMTAEIKRHMSHLFCPTELKGSFYLYVGLFVMSAKYGLIN